LVTSPGKPKAVRRLVLSGVLLVGFVVVALVANDPSLRAVAIAFAAILGLPFVLMSSIDLGRVLRSESDGNVRASRATWLLSHVQAAFGAVCMAAAAYAIYHNVNLWRDGTADFHGAMLFIWIPIGLALILVGFNFIRTAFAPERREVPGNDT
jgi:hypothetical protein